MKLELKKLLGNIILIAIFLILFVRVTSIITDTEQPTPVSVIISDSMVPTMHRGDIVFWVPTSIENVKVDDIIVFRSSVHDATVTHRVIEVREGTAGIELITKGDANEYADQMGPHFPERPVRSTNFHGKVVSVGNQPLRIPFAGHLWITLDGLLALLLGGAFGGGGILVFIPIITAGVMLIGMILILPEEDDDDDESRKVIRQIIGRENKIHVLAVFLILVMAFMLVIMPATWYAYDDYNISIGVGQQSEPADEAFSYVRPGQVINGTHRLYNPGFVHVNIYTYAEGEGSTWMKVDDEYIDVDSRTTTEETFSITVPEHADRGTYSFTVYHYHSPFWALYPRSLITSTLNDNPRSGILYLNALTALIFASLTMAVMLIVSFVIDEYNLWKEYYRARKVYHSTETMGDTPGFKFYLLFTAFTAWLSSKFDWLRGLDVVEFDLERPLTAASVALVALPMVWLGVDMWILPVMVAIATGTAYYLECRWRAELFTAGMTAGLITMISLYIVPMMLSAPGGLESLTLAGMSTAVALIIFVLLSPIILFISYVTAITIHWIKLKNSPISPLEITDL